MQPAYAGWVTGKDSQEVKYVGILFKIRVNGLNGPEDVYRKGLVHVDQYFYTKPDGSKGVSEAWNDNINYTFLLDAYRDERVALPEEAYWIEDLMEDIPAYGDSSYEGNKYFVPDYFYMGGGSRESVEKYKLTSAQTYYDMTTRPVETAPRESAVYKK